MLIVDVLEKVQNKQLSNTRFYDKDWKPDCTSEVPVRTQSYENHKRFNLYCEIFEAVGDGYLKGEKVIVDESTHYDDLRLTKEGKEHLKLMNTPINNILKPSLAEVVTKSVLGRLIAVLLVPVIIYSFSYLFPDFSESAWSCLNTTLSYIKNRWQS